MSVRKGNGYIMKTYNKGSHNKFLNELGVYLLARQKGLDFIPELLDYNVSKRRLKIKNVGESMKDLYKGDMKKKCSYRKRIMDMYKKLVKEGLYHNDLRYKNVIHNRKTDKLYLIDFEFTSKKYEDKDDDRIITPLKCRDVFNFE
tara:strand:- start:452 stop:886 length:435 start_codon:yes stop_codon:yes gene_type:complete